MVSITTRFTGVGLSAGIAAAGVSCLVTDPDNLPLFLESIKQAAPAIVPVLKAVVAFPLVFHTVAGIRHLVWDQTVRGFDLPSMRNSSIAVAAIAGAGTLLLALVELEDQSATAKKH
jgi:succinate dehydrogenase (ubiquinone) cytochrome b560 subunit